MVCVVCVFGGEASDVIYLLEELRLGKTVSSSWFGVWGKHRGLVYPKPRYSTGFGAKNPFAL